MGLHLQSFFNSDQDSFCDCNDVTDKESQSLSWMALFCIVRPQFSQKDELCFLCFAR